MVLIGILHKMAGIVNASSVHFIVSLLFLLSHWSFETGSVIVPILQMRKLRPERESNFLTVTQLVRS